MQQEPKCGCSQSSFTLKGARTGFSKNQKTERHEIAEFVIQHFHWVIAYQHVFYIHAASSTSTRSTQSVRLIEKRFHCRLLFISRRALNGHNWNQLRVVCTFLLGARFNYLFIESAVAGAIKDNSLGQACTLVESQMGLGEFCFERLLAAREENSERISREREENLR